MPVTSPATNPILKASALRAGKVQEAGHPFPFFLSPHSGIRCLTAGDTRFPLNILEIRAGGLAFEF